jgi:hypothetical protein
MKIALLLRSATRLAALLLVEKAPPQNARYAATRLAPIHANNFLCTDNQSRVKMERNHPRYVCTHSPVILSSFNTHERKMEQIAGAEMENFYQYL